MCNVTTIITYGRPGTPMQAWGVAGGGPKNDQSIQDLVAFLRTIQLKPSDIKAQQAKNLAARALDESEDPVPAVHELPGHPGSGRAPDAQDRHRRARRRAQALQTALKTPDATDKELTASCDAITKLTDTDPAKVDRKQAAACGVFLDRADTGADRRRPRSRGRRSGRGAGRT